MARRDRDSRNKKSSDKSNRGSRRSKRRGNKRNYTYKKRDVDSVRRRSKQGADDRDQIFKEGVKILKLKEENSIRILPPTWDDADHYAYDIYIHYGIGPDESSFICLDKLNDPDEECPICEERAKAEAAGDSDYASSLKATKRPVCYVLDRDEEDEGPLLWAMPWTLDRDLSAQSFDKRSGEVIPLDDPYEGFDVSFSKTGKGMKTKYVGLSIGRRSSEASDDIDDIIDTIQETPVPDNLNIQEADYIAKVFSGHNSKKSEDNRRDSRNKDTESDYSWKEVHKMDFEDLGELVEDEKLNDVIDIDDYGNDEEEELADIICEELGIDKPEKKSNRDKKRSKEMRKNRR